MGRRIFSKVFLFRQKNYWLLKTQACLFCQNPKIFGSSTKKGYKIFFNEKNFYSKRLLWTYKKQFWKSSFILFAKKPKTDLTKYEKISWAEFFQFQNNEFYWKCSQNVRKFLAQDLNLFMKTFFSKKIPEKDLLDKYNTISTPLTKHISTPIKKLEKIDFLNLLSLNTSLWTRRMKLWPARRFFSPTFRNVFVHCGGVIKKPNMTSN